MLTFEILIDCLFHVRPSYFCSLFKVSSRYADMLMQLRATDEVLLLHPSLIWEKLFFTLSYLDISQPKWFPKCRLLVHVNWCEIAKFIQYTTGQVSKSQPLD